MNKEAIKLICLLLAITLIPLVKTQTQTELQVPYTNIAPIFSGIIPNLTWAKNTNLTNSINLNEYFSDNQSLSFSYNSVQNISIIINTTTVGNQTANLVSFYPNTNFEGVRNITFVATDGEKNTSSNIVYLNVTGDTRPPLWSNPSKDRSEVYQNLLVRFSTTWTDDVMLDNYIFFIKQNGAWTNSTDVGFSGTLATSLYTIQISAAPASGVEWYFTAYDSSGNSNTTEMQNFTVLNNPTSNSSSSSSSSSGSSSSGSISTVKTVKEQLEEIKKFKVEPATSFRIETKQGQTNTISIKITNIGNQIISFELSHTGLNDFEVVMSEESFDLEPSESKTVIMEIKAGKNLSPGIYIGILKIYSSGETVEIPIIIEVNKLDTKYSVDLIMDEKSKKVKPGERVFANITINSLKDVVETEATLYYAIRDYDGLVLDFKEEVVTLNKKDYEQNINLTTTKESHTGEHILYIRATIENETILSSDIFEIGYRINLKTFIRTNLIIIIILIILISIIIFILKYRSNKERLRLLNLYVMVKEMKSQMDSGKIDEAIETFVKIKSLYNEKIYDQSNKEYLKNQMKDFTEKYIKMEKEMEVIQNRIETKKEDKIEKKEDSDTKIIIKEEQIDKKEDKIEKKDTNLDKTNKEVKNEKKVIELKEETNIANKEKPKKLKKTKEKIKKKK